MSRSSISSTSSSARTTPSTTSRIPSRSSTRSTGSTRTRTTPSTWATRPSTCAPPRRLACTRSPSPGAASTRTRRLRSRSRTRSCTRQRSSVPPSSATVQQRAEELRVLLHRYNHAYHVLDEPEVEDAVWDALFDELQRLEEEHPELATDDSPTRRVGAAPSERFRKV